MVFNDILVCKYIYIYINIYIYIHANKYFLGRFHPFTVHEGP